VPVAPDYAPSLAASERRRPPQRAAPKNSRRGFFGTPSGRTLARRHLPHATAPGYRACGYKTASGRPKWLNRDPIGIAGGINLYAYVDNNPITGIDPLGLVNWRKVATGSLTVVGSIGGEIVGIATAEIGVGVPIVIGSTISFGLGATTIAQGFADNGSAPTTIPQGPIELGASMSHNPNAQTFGAIADNLLPFPTDAWALPSVMNSLINPPEFDPNYWPFKYPDNPPSPLDPKKNPKKSCP
jgi:RHS repeat-associated protein